MPFQVFLTDDAARDLEDLYEYIELHAVPGMADYVLEQIEKALAGLSENPQRGAYPKELVTIGPGEYLRIPTFPATQSDAKRPPRRVLGRRCRLPLKSGRFGEHGTGSVGRAGAPNLPPLVAAAALKGSTLFLSPGLTPLLLGPRQGPPASFVATPPAVRSCRRCAPGGPG